MFEVNITKWIEKEIAQTEMQLLRAEDDAADAALRVKALQQRMARLRGKHDKRTRSLTPDTKPTRVMRALRKVGAA